MAILRIIRTQSRLNKLKHIERAVPVNSASYNSKMFTGMIAGIANLGIQYSFTSASVALLLINKIYSDVPGWADATITSSIFAGNIVGMLFMGLLGDTIGRIRALEITLMIAVVGSLASAFATFGNSSNTFLLLSLWRVLLGIGVGGIYPLSSVFAYESEASGYSSIPDAQDDENENAVVAVNQDSADKKGSIKSATALFWQLPGQICVYIVAMGLLVFSLPYTYQWRLLLASGAFPFVASSLFLSNSTENRPTLPGTGNESFKATFDALQSVFKDRSQRIQLLGASTAWFLFDIYLYGVGLYSTLILRLIFSSDDLFSNYWENVVAIMASLPAGIFSIYALKYYQLRTLQCVGFTITALSFWVYALLWDTLESKPAYLFILFCYLKFAMACFVPSTTFAMPNSLFDKSVRASCCGIAAASGKLGAFVGTFLFPLVYHSSGFAMVLVYCGLVSSLGLIVTMIAIPAENALETDIRRADVFRQSKKDGIAAHSPRTMKTVSSSEVRQELTI